MINYFSQPLTECKAEEINGSSRVTPQTMTWAYMFNVPLAFAMMLVFLFAMSDVASATMEAFPFVWVLRNSLSTAGATAITALMFILIVMTTTNAFASTARQAFAFARDGGLPFSSWMKKVLLRGKNRDQKNILTVNAGQSRIERCCKRFLRDLGLHSGYVSHLSRKSSRVQCNVSFTILCHTNRAFAASPVAQKLMFSLISLFR